MYSPRVYIIDKTWFDECFFIPCDIWKILCFTQIYRYPEVRCNCHVAAFFEISVLKGVRILFSLSPQ